MTKDKGQLFLKCFKDIFAKDVSILDFVLEYMSYSCNNIRTLNVIHYFIFHIIQSHLCIQINSSLVQNNRTRG